MSEDLGQRIAHRAYEHFLARGGAHGHHVEDWLAAEMVMNDACFAENGQGKRFARLAHVEAEDHGARLEPVVQAEHSGRRWLDAL